MRKGKRRQLSQDKRLVERYFRFAMSRGGRRIGRRIARLLNRRSMMRDARRRMKAIDEAIRTIAAESSRAKRHGLDASWKVLNLALFYLIAERDVQAVRVDALTHPDPWHRALASRVLMLTMHELDLDKAGGRQFNDIVSANGLPESLRDEVRDIMRSMRREQAKMKLQFAHIRHSTIAHRDPDAMLQYRDILSIDELAVATSTTSYYREANRFIDMLPRLMAHLGGVQQILEQLRISGRVP